MNEARAINVFDICRKIKTTVDSFWESRSDVSKTKRCKWIEKKQKTTQNNINDFSRQNVHFFADFNISRRIVWLKMFCPNGALHF